MKLVGKIGKMNLSAPGNAAVHKLKSLAETCATFASSLQHMAKYGKDSPGDNVIDYDRAQDEMNNAELCVEDSRLYISYF